MSITKEQAKKEFERLAHFKGAPVTSGAWADCHNVLVRHCRDIEHCREVIADYIAHPRNDLDGTPLFPSVFELRSLALAGSDVDTFKPLQTYAGECPHCNGTYWLSSTRLVEGVAYDFSRPCVCRAARVEAMA